MSEAQNELRELLIRIVQTQNDAAALVSAIQADVETLRWALSLVLPPQYDANLGKVLAENRERYAKEIERKKAELELLRAEGSKTIQ